MEKWHHLHNSFLLLEANPALDLDSELASRLCSAHRTDGLLAYHPQDTTHGNQGYLEVTSFFNDDGSPAEYCGNAHACLASVAYQQGKCLSKFGKFWIEAQPLPDEAGEKPFMYTYKPFPWTTYEVRMFNSSAVTHPEWKRLKLTGYALTVGVPHVIFLIDSSHEEALIRYRFASKAALDALQSSEAFPGGTNVTFVFMGGDKQPVGSRTYERGCRRFTHACGSGLLAAWVVMLQRQKIPVKTWLDWQPGPHSVRVKVENDGLHMISKAYKEAL
jgi:diaminopimelate epimerase